MTKTHLIRVYREAARLVAEGRGGWSCWVVALVVDRNAKTFHCEESDLYAAIMEFGLNSVPFDERQNIRVLLLLLMAEYIATDYEA